MTVMKLFMRLLAEIAKGNGDLKIVVRVKAGSGYVDAHEKWEVFENCNNGITINIEDF